MNGLTLCFSTYFQCVVKGTTTMHQYDAVCLLLEGKKMKESGVSLTNTTASFYANGKKPVPEAVLGKLMECKNDEIIRRLKLLNFQGIDFIVKALSNLIDIVTNLSPAEKAALKELSVEENKQYDYLATVFLNAMKCPAHRICNIDADVKNTISALRAAAFGISASKNPKAHAERNPQKKDLGARSSPDSGVFDTIRAVSAYIMEVASPFEQEAVADFIVINNAVIKINKDDVLRVFPDKAQDFRHVLASISGPVKRVIDFLENSTFISGADALVLAIEYSGDITLDDNEQLCNAIYRQVENGASLTFSAGFNPSFLPMYCDARLICRIPKPEQQIQQEDQYFRKAKRLGKKLIPLYDILNITCASDWNLRDNWQRSDSSTSLAVPIGRCENNSIFKLDLQENSHGPHAILAGMRGSGKCEFILSYIASSALKFHPHDMGFIILDFKKDMPSAVSRLPHVLGMASSMERESLESTIERISDEVLRRQKSLLINDFVDINQYISALKKGKPISPLPHIIIIVNEFTMLEQRYPDLMEKLLNIGRTGKNYGIHFLFITQFPTRIPVSILTNYANIRLCLKVADEYDSSTMLQSPLAYYLQVRGRGFYQVGIDTNISQFQCGYCTERMHNWSMPHPSQLDCIIDYVENYCANNAILRLPDIF